MEKPLRPSKDFENTWAFKWDWETIELRQATRAGEVKRAGGTKYEVYVKAGGKGGKVATVDCEDKIIALTGVEEK